MVMTVFRFFVVEDHILHTSRGLVNRSYMDQLWDMALNKIVAALRIHTVSDNGDHIDDTNILGMCWLAHEADATNVNSPSLSLV